MKKIFYCFTMLIIFLSSCSKEQVGPDQPPNPPSPNITDTTSIDSTVTLSGQQWVLTAYRIGELGGPISRNDTLIFLSTSVYKYNVSPSTYSIYPAMASYSLTLNGTFLGNISGALYDYNLMNGVVDGLKFNDITTGGSGQNYYIWMHKL